jgi:hypothetical protein
VPPQEAPAGPHERATVAAGAIALGSALFLLALAHHAEGAPPHGAVEAVRMLAAEDPAQKLVHALLFLCAAVMFFGYAGFALRIGLREAPALAGLIAYAIATASLMAQTLLDGIVLPAAAAHYASAPGADLAAMGPTLLVAAALLAALFQLWIVSSAGAVLLWSAELLRRPGSNRAAGALGLAAGLLPIAALAVPAAHARLHTPLGVGAIAGLQALWGLAVAAQLARGRL